jgi:hypothetical protein
MKKRLIIIFCLAIGVSALIVQSKQVNYMYIDSPEGLNVRKSPSLDGEIIYLLQNKTKIEVVQINDEKVNIDGILGNWVLIKTATTQGWVFGGFLVQNISDISDNWITCTTYKYRRRAYPMSIEETAYSDTSAFEFIAKILKNYFYPNVTTKDFYLSFYYPLVRYIPKYRDGLFEETDVEIQEDGTKHNFKYYAQGNGGNGYIITVGQYKNTIAIKEMQFTIIFYEDYIECPELINSELIQKIKLIDLTDKDLEMKIKTAYVLKDLYEAVGLHEGIFTEIIIEKFDFNKILNTDYSEIYMNILQRNGIVLGEMEREILYRKLHYEILNYK